MKTNNISYDLTKSVERIDSILNSSNSSFEESSSIPNRDKLTYKNGYYVNVGAIFVDIRESSSLTDEHKRPKLAKLYRSYISEVVAILNSYSDCKDINIVGDCVSGIFDAQYRYQLANMFDASAKINSLIKILNYKLRKNGIVEVSIGIGLDYGRALMIQAGFYGSGINEVVWMGDVVNSSSNLCNKANKGMNHVILVSQSVYGNLSEEDKKLLEYNYNESCYHGNIINLSMEEWYKNNCK